MIIDGQQKIHNYTYFIKMFHHYITYGYLLDVKRFILFHNHREEFSF